CERDTPRDSWSIEEELLVTEIGAREPSVEAHMFDEVRHAEVEAHQIRHHVLAGRSAWPPRPPCLPHGDNASDDDAREQRVAACRIPPAFLLRGPGERARTVGVPLLTHEEARVVPVP